MTEDEVKEVREHVTELKDLVEKTSVKNFKEANKLLSEVSTLLDHVHSHTEVP